MAVEYTATVDVTGEGRNGGVVAAAAHQICPYSKATRGNIAVTINAGVL